MKKVLLILVLPLLMLKLSFGGEVNFEKGYYYIVIKNGNFDKVNAVLQQEIQNHKWGIIHTMNVDKTIKSNTPHKTYLLCHADYLTEGIKFNKDVISVLIPCRISIYQDKNDVKILVEDVEAASTNFGIEDKKFKAFLRQVADEMKSILQKTSDHFEKKSLTPQM
jgi:uncharacterized protein (DUF302 family)